jgi:hypothetical protein
MQEHFLHYIWEHQYFDTHDLKTSRGDLVSVIKPGVYNTHAGPDFSQARVRIGSLEWNGPVEIHTRSSDWDHHGHTTDPAYGNVILHVVWHHDAPEKELPDMPVLELRHRIDPALMEKYRNLVHSLGVVPCEGQLPEVDALTKLSMMEAALMERMETKAVAIKGLLKANTGDWEETTYQAFARNFGFKVNADAFLELSSALPYKILLKHNASLPHLEALLFGMAGFLDDDHPEPYLKELTREFQFFSHKYSLQSQQMEPFQWKFLRLRPPNFPTVRLAQFAAFLHKNPHLFSIMLETTEINHLLAHLRVNQSEYWKKHFRPGIPAVGSVPGMGRASAENLLINTVVPLRVAYAQEHGEPHRIDGAIALLEQLRPESNSILSRWTPLGMQASHAADSQGLIELYNNYCKKRRCLHCRIGARLVRPSS